MEARQKDSYLSCQSDSRTALRVPIVLPEAPRKWKARPRLAATRNTQLDGWRAFAVAGVMWFHWAPKAWQGPFPFEIGLYFFLTLTGFLITRILLRERAAGEHTGGSWRRRAYAGFQHRRLARILGPCYAAMLFAIAVGAPDIRENPLVYFAHVSNFHMAAMDGWPPGTAHYWTLAIQIQFYFFWPLVVFLAPKRLLPAAFAACVALAPLARFACARWFPEIHHPGAVSLCAFDYFGCGALLALAFERGVLREGDRRIAATGWLAFAAYAALYTLHETGHRVPALGHLQQTLLAIAFSGLISSTLAGFRGRRRRVLDHPAVQHVGRISYGIYLFHTLVPLLLGWVMPFLWNPFFSGPMELARLAVFALASWGAAWLCWRWLEGPDRLRLRMPERARG